MSARDTLSSARRASARRSLDRVRHHARRPLARTPYLWDAAILARPGKRATLVRRDTDLVLEGFLRSGNTFSVAAFEVANGSGARLAHHLHGAPHLLRAARLGRPAVLLIRSPTDAVTSYLIRRPTLTARDGVLEYLDFYRTAWRARDSVVVATFEQVTGDFGAVIDRVNARFGTTFERYAGTAEDEEAAFAIVEEMNRRECEGDLVETHVGRPSAERDAVKARVREQLRDPRAAGLLHEAEVLYARYEALARA